MSDDADRLSHPDLGLLVWSEAHSWWKGERRLACGASIAVLIEPGDAGRHAFLSQAARLVPWAMANERRILA